MHCQILRLAWVIFMKMLVVWKRIVWTVSGSFTFCQLTLFDTHWSRCVYALVSTCRFQIVTVRVDLIAHCRLAVVKRE